MGRFVYSSRAEDDFLEIATYGLEQFGVLQADRYVEQLEQACARLTEFPSMGRPQSIGVLRFEEGSHVIFYRRQRGEILIARILHKSCDPLRHVI